MPKLERSIIDVVTLKVFGPVDYRGFNDKAKVKRFREMAGITKGQWKRFNASITKDKTHEKHIRVSLLTQRKLKVMLEYPDNPHLETLLKIAEIQMDEEA